VESVLYLDAETDPPAVSPDHTWGVFPLRVGFRTKKTSLFLILAAVPMKDEEVTPGTFPKELKISRKRMVSKKSERGGGTIEELQSPITNS